MTGVANSSPIVRSVLASLPAVAARALDIERENRLPADLAQLLVELGIGGMGVAQSYGGLESSPREMLWVIEALSAADASTGWCAMNYLTSAHQSGFMNPEWAKIVFSAEQMPLIAGAVAPSGRGRLTQGGMIATGKWGFGSGCDNADLMIGTTMMIDDAGSPLKDEAGQPLIVAPFFDRSQFVIHPNWQVSGLKGTGSHDWSVKDVFVPEGHWLKFDVSPIVNKPLYRFPYYSLFPAAVASVPLGIARSAVETLVAAAPLRVPVGKTTSLAEQASIQICVATAESRVRAARAYLNEVVDDLWQAALKADEPTIEQRRQVRLAAAHAAKEAVAVVDDMYNAAGSAVIYDSHPLQRYLRDVHAAAQHVQIGRFSFQAMGELYLTGTTDWQV